MSFDSVQQWLDQVESARASQRGSQDNDRPKHQDVLTPPSTSLLPPSAGIKRDLETQSLVMDPPKRPRRGARDSEVQSATSSSILPLRDELTLSPSVSTASQSQSRQRSPSPTRIKRLLEYATPRVRYLNEWEDPEDSVVQELRDFLSHRPTNWEPNPDKLREVVTGARKCSAQQRSESSWVTEVTRPAIQAAIDDLPLESWGVQTETVSTEYQPHYTARDRCNRKIDWVVGLPKERWESLYARATAKFAAADINHVDHPHTSSQVLGCGCEIKPSTGNLVEAEVQLGVWTAGFFSWAFEQRSGSKNPPPMVGFIPVGVTWGFYIIYGVQDRAEDGRQSRLSEVRVWGPLPELAGQATERTCSALIKTLRRVMEYVCGRYIEELQESVFT